MDPDKTWELLVEQLAEPLQTRDCEAALEAALALHEWLKRGGFMPQFAASAGLTAQSLDNLLLPLIDVLQCQVDIGG